MIGIIVLLIQVIQPLKTCVSSVDLNQLELENQDGASRNPRIAFLAVRKLRRNCQLPLVALFHELKRLSPSLDDLVSGNEDRGVFFDILCTTGFGTLQ